MILEVVSRFWISDSAERESFNITIESIVEVAGFSGEQVAGIAGEYRIDHREPPKSVCATPHGIPINKWTHVAIVRRKIDDDQYEYRWYFDGVEDSFQTTIVDGPLPSSGVWTIGGRPGFPARVLIDEVRFWSGPAGKNEMMINRQGDRTRRSR
ncbi:MAG: hypothetical protein CMJ78_16705 [Planctomycetaceae bacterium]|nr:hypothetical protein [Planctomycetaceae bacterium]